MKLLVTLAVLGVIILTACSTPPADFEDMEWVLKEYGEKGALQPVLAGSEITATFDSTEGQLTGSAGCNSYFASYTVADTAITQGGITIGAIGNTEMYCEGLMDQETAFLTLLDEVAHLLLKDDQLTISGGLQSLVFERR